VMIPWVSQLIAPLVVILAHLSLHLSPFFIPLVFIFSSDLGECMYCSHPAVSFVDYFTDNLNVGDNGKNFVLFQDDQRG